MAWEDDVVDAVLGVSTGTRVFGVEPSSKQHNVSLSGPAAAAAEVVRASKSHTSQPPRPPGLSSPLKRPLHLRTEYDEGRMNI